jgi:flagellar hook-basal body complex protein FliE
MQPLIASIGAAVTAAPVTCLTAPAGSAAVTGGVPFTNSSGATNGPATPFSDLLSDAVSQVGDLDSRARAAVTGLMTGNGVDVHQAMIATEKADMAFEMTLAVRNKAVQAYQQVMSMQF